VLISTQIAIPGDLPLCHSQVSANWKGDKSKQKSVKEKSREAFTLYERTGNSYLCFSTTQILAQPKRFPPWGLPSIVNAVGAICQGWQIEF
jgi:hypothetical protein